MDSYAKYLLEQELPKTEAQRRIDGRHVDDGTWELFHVGIQQPRLAPDGGDTQTGAHTQSETRPYMQTTLGHNAVVVQGRMATGDELYARSAPRPRRSRAHMQAQPGRRMKHTRPGQLLDATLPSDWGSAARPTRLRKQKRHMYSTYAAPLTDGQR